MKLPPATRPCLRCHPVYRGVIPEPNMWGHAAHKHVAVARSGPIVQNIAGQQAGQKLGQRHGQRVARLALDDGDRLAWPVDVRQAQLDDVAGPQPRR